MKARVQTKGLVMRQKKLVAALSAVVVAMVVVAVCIAVFSGRPETSSAEGAAGAKPRVEAEQGKELVKIDWQSEKHKAGDKQKEGSASGQPAEPGPVEHEPTEPGTARQEEQETD
jgi:hypothetical protein